MKRNLHKLVKWNKWLEIQIIMNKEQGRGRDEKGDGEKRESQFSDLGIPYGRKLGHPAKQIKLLSVLFPMMALKQGRTD